MTTTPRKPRRRKVKADVPKCDRCGRELCVWWRGRAWCVRCDAGRLFDDEPGEDGGGEDGGDTTHERTKSKKGAL